MEEDFDYEGFDPEVVRLVEVCHANAHDAEHDLEDGVLISMTKREIWLFTLAMIVVSQSATCLADDCATLTERMVELMDVQKPHWRTRPERLN